MMLIQMRRRLSERLLASLLAAVSMGGFVCAVSYLSRPLAGIYFYAIWFMVLALLALPFSTMIADRVSRNRAFVLIGLGAIITLGSNWSPPVPAWMQWILIFVHAAAFVGLCIGVTGIFLSNSGRSSN